MSVDSSTRREKSSQPDEGKLTPRRVRELIRGGRTSLVPERLAEPPWVEVNLRTTMLEQAVETERGRVQEIEKRLAEI